MRRLVLCLPALLLCVLAGCRTEEAWGNLNEASQKVVLIWDDKEETYDWVEQIGEKIDIIELGLSGKKSVLNEAVKKADLVIAGAYGGEDDWKKILDAVINLEEMQGKRLTFFCVQEKGGKIRDWEYQSEEGENEVVLLPGIVLPEETENPEEEQSRIDGWLTTAFTWQKDRLLKKTGA